MKKYYKLILLTLLLMLISTEFVFADNNIKVMEVQDSGDNPVIFVKGYEGDVDSKAVSALISNTVCPKVSCEKLNEGNTNLDTLILLDNSMSIPTDARETIKEWVADFIADRKPYERFSIATYGEDIENLIDFTDEYSELKQVLDSVEYKDRETYLTDVLYDLVNSDSFKENSDGAYRRIIVISDGVDNKNVGYTSDELVSLLNENGMPVYTIGVYNKKKANGDDISKLFSLSRATNATSATYGTDEVNELKESLKEDRNIIRFEIKAEDAVKDGSEKTVTISIDDEQLVTVDNVRMTQIVAEEEEIDEKVIEEIVQDEIEDEEDEEDFVPEPEPTFFDQYRLFILAGAAVAAVLVIIVIIYIILIISRNKKRANQIIETEDPFANIDNESKTEMMFDMPINNDDDGSTVYIFDQGRSYTVTLTDVVTPARMYQKPIKDKLIIGRSLTKADLVIDYDQSISSRHCMIERRGDKFYLVDLQSSNGTFLNDSRVLSEVEIYSGSILKMGRVQMKIELS